MKYDIIRTDKADALIRKIVLFVAEQFGSETALNKLDEIERSIMLLADDPYLGEEPRYMVLRRQGYRVMILEKDLVFYKIDENHRNICLTFTVNGIDKG